MRTLVILLSGILIGANGLANERRAPVLTGDYALNTEASLRQLWHQRVVDGSLEAEELKQLRAQGYGCSQVFSNSWKCRKNVRDQFPDIPSEISFAAKRKIPGPVIEIVEPEKFPEQVHKSPLFDQWKVFQPAKWGRTTAEYILVSVYDDFYKLALKSVADETIATLSSPNTDTLRMQVRVSRGNWRDRKVYVLRYKFKKQ